MSSLYRRATGPQSRMLTIVSGAVLNAAHAHPGHAVDKRFARSVAKRAVGTLSAQWQEVLAASGTPSGAERSGVASFRNGSHTGKARGGRHTQGSAGPRFHKAIVQEVSRLIRPAKEAGQTERAGALIDVMRIIDRIVKRAASASVDTSAGEGK